MEETKRTIDISDRLYKIILAVIGLAAVFVIGQIMYDFRALPQNFPREITVTGEGKALAKPDIAMISFGVTSESKKSQDAVNQNNQKMNAIIKSIKDLGVGEKDIKTTSYNLYPVYGTERSSPIYYKVIDNNITGYRLEQQVEVKIRNFDKINEIIDSATSSGANTVGSLQFTVDDIEKVKAEARLKAIEQAKERAKTLINQAGLRIERLINISEGYGPYPSPIYDLGAGGAVTRESVAPQIEPGQTEINVSITLTYRIK
ncbi:MAG: SIMPL domain-containing protein [Patescibacteria group bacterium]